MNTSEKAKLFLRQSVADQLQKPIRRIKTTSGFYELGLKSADAVRLVKRIEQIVGERLPASLLFKHPTIKGLSIFLAEKYAPVFDKLLARKTQKTTAATAKPKRELTPLKRSRFQKNEHVLSSDPGAERLRSIPLTDGQKGLWALQKMAPEMSPYNVPLCYRILDRIDGSVLDNALRFLLEQHPILTSVVHEQNGMLNLAFQPRCPGSVQKIDASAFESDRLFATMEEETKKAFDLEKGPLLRVSLFVRSDKETYLLFVLHHIIFDGLSITPFLKTLFSAYRAIAAGKRPAVQPVTVDFASFAHREQAMVQGKEGEARLRYWRNQLSGALPLLKLQADKPRDGSRVLVGRTEVRELTADLAKRASRFAKTRRVYPSTLFLAVFKLLLHRMTHEKDIIVGLVANQRPGPEYNDAIGYFLGMLPIRSSCTRDAAFGEFLQELQATLLEGFAHFYPFPALVRSLDIAHTAEEPPIFQVSYIYQNALQPEDLQKAQAPSSLPMEYIDVFHTEGGYELSLEVFEGPGEFFLHLKYNPDLFHRDAIGRLLDHYVRLCEGAIGNPDALLSDIPILTDHERRVLLNDWNDSERSYPEDKCFHELFEERAALHPDRTALVFGDRFLTFTALERESAVLALRLQGMGVGPGHLVGICTDRSLLMMIGLLGVARAGAAYVPLDPEYPASRLAYMIRDSKTPLVLTRESFRHKLEEMLPKETQLLLLDEPRFASGHVASNHRRIEKWVQPEHPAYTIYTSGSTGNPKGVMVPHRALTNFLSSMRERPGFSSGEKLLAVTTFCFDIAGLELFLPLIADGCCVLPTAATLSDPSRLQTLIRDARPTVMQATPATWTLLFAAGWRNREGLKILCGGEALPEILRDQFIETGSETWNMFGPTETTIWSTIQPIRADESVTIGKPIANTQIYILDSRMNPVPIGVPGELFIGGQGLATGYPNLPGMTAERFCVNPFGSGARMYRTGDLARWSSEGTIGFLGRVDHQVKIRGFRIELGDIEARLDRFPGIEMSAVVIREEQNHRSLIAYFTVSTEKIDARALRDYLKENLPEYMAPTHLIELESLPLTPNGKVDRKTLMRRKISGRGTRGPSLPESELEKKVLVIWQRFLHTEDINVTDGFFEVGGNSLSAVIVAENIKKTLDPGFDVTALFRYPTVRDICRFLNKDETRPMPTQEVKTRSPRIDSPKPSIADKGLPDYYGESLAVIGISCQFPGAADWRAFWENLCEGRESGGFYSEQELRDLGVAEDVIRDPLLVPRHMTIDGKDLFDPDFFGITPRDALFMDPQFRHLLQHAWRAVEDAGYIPASIPETGVFMSASAGFYQGLFLDFSRTGYVMDDSEDYVAWLLAQGGTIPTTISYKLGLRGPSLFVHTNCSSSLTGLHLAYRSLMAGEARYALVGGATLMPGRGLGYLHQPGLNFSSDGHCRAFDADADGMISGEGVGVLLVKKADEAVADGDHIYALLRGSAINNDGDDKVGFYAPSVSGQNAVIREALAEAKVAPESVGYVEAHGTGTRIGDPIEFAALTDAYPPLNGRKRIRGLGSVKTNLGHLDAAAALAGCAKVILSLYHQKIPPSLHYTRPNPTSRSRNRLSTSWID